MGEAARKIDLIDTAPKFTASDAKVIEARWAGVEAAIMLRGLFA